MVAADVDDPASLRLAFEGAHGAFCVTFFWDHFSVEKEKAQAKAMAEAARAAGVAHAIWSTLDDTRERVPLSDDRMPTLQGQYKVPHFDGKGESNRYFREAGVPTTFLLTSFYWDNLIHFGMGPKPGPDGNLVFKRFDQAIDLMSDVAVDPLGSIVITGAHYTSVGAHATAFLDKLDDAGTLLWQKTGTLGTIEGAGAGVDTDSCGNVLWVANGLTPGVGTQTVLIKLAL